MLTQETLMAVLSEVLDRVDTATLRPDLPLAEQGIDSLDRAAIFLELEERLGITVTDEEMDALPTLEAILAHVNATPGDRDES